MEGIFPQLSEENKSIFYNFVSFPDFFFIDWFPEFPASRILAVTKTLEQKKWISPNKDKFGSYSWTPDFPRQKAVEKIGPENMSRLYRNAACILKKEWPESEGKNSSICKLYIMAGLQQDDLDACLEAALREESNHRISSAIFIYEAMLGLLEKIIREEEIEIRRDIWNIFVKVMERRVPLSLFHLNIKKNNQYLSLALEAAKKLNDTRAQASLELLAGQNYWMAFKYSEAALHYNNGWNIITQMEDEELYKRGLRLKGLILWSSGQLSEAIESYEKSLGELESDDDDNFSSLTALNLALCYVQVGMPQRAFGISERIQNHSKKKANWPIYAYALVSMGMILLELRQVNSSRTYLNDAFEIAKRESLPTAEVLAGIGLASIECLEGRYQLAEEYYKALWRVPKSSWYYFVNFYPFLETAFILHSRGYVEPIELGPPLEFLNKQDKDQINALMHGMIQRFHLYLPNNNLHIKEKIDRFLELEISVKNMGANFELARIRVELAKLYNQNREWQLAESYAQMAYEFFKPFARNCFPSELLTLISIENKSKDERLFDLIIEMGDALTEQENLERLLANIINSVSRLTGAERSALFIKHDKSAELKMAASRNLLKEEIQEPNFKKYIAAIHSVMSSGEMEIINDDEERQFQADNRRAVITPLCSGKKIVGVLYQDSRFFLLNSGSEMKLLSALASQIGVSIDRAQAYEEIAKLNNQLLLEKSYYLEEIEEFRPFSDIIGKSDAVRTLHELIKKVAPTNSTVLICGETGVGKELVARAIHRESSRKEGPFIRVNCAALPDSLIDSELFGHEKGAFTGAIKTKAGRFELANRGTIFLDEVSELPLPTQSKLLRIIQEKEFQRVGGTKVLHSDFRLLTATNKDLHEEVKVKKFREDLYYRLNVFPVHVAPLRERKEDIPLLAIHFLDLFCTQNNKINKGISEYEMKILQNYPWPGNIRELSNMIERSVISGNQISFPELDKPEIKRQVQESCRDLKNYVKDVERKRILDALDKTRGKVSGKNGAAELLGMNRSALIHRMRKLGIQIERSPK